MNYQDLSENIVEEIKESMSKTSEDQLSAALVLLDSAKRIFVCGAGRSRLVAGAFVMRLVHTGCTAYLVGDVTTPAIGKEDLLVVCSGSGETSSMKIYAESASKAGAKILLFTTKESSSIADISDSLVMLHAKAAKNNGAGDARSIQPMSNLFAQVLGLTMDILVIELMNKRNIDETLMKEFHANLE